MILSDLVRLRGGDFSTSHSFQTFEDVAMRIDAVKKYFNSPSHFLTEEQVEFFAMYDDKRIDKDPNSPANWDRKTLMAMFAKDTEYFFRQIVSRYTETLFPHLSPEENVEFCEHLESLVSFCKFTERKANEV